MAPRDVNAPPPSTPGPTTDHQSSADAGSGTFSSGPQSSVSYSGFAAGNAAGFASALPAVSFPKGGGAIRGIDEKLDVNPSSGSCTLSIPITVSQARSTAGTPSLTLSYNSGAGNGPFGLGWGITVASITRKTDKGLPRYLDAANECQDDEDVFVFSGVEDLVPRLHQTTSSSAWTVDEAVRGNYIIRRYLPRIEGSFFRIERCTNCHDCDDVFWRVRTGDDQESIFGRNAESRISDGQGRIYSWLLSDTNDRYGNAIEYSYQAEDSVAVAVGLAACERNRTEVTRARNRYLKCIKYGNRIPHSRLATPTPDPVAGPWMFEVVFDYGKHGDLGVVDWPWTCRQDPFSTYRAGFEIRSYRLCHRIRMFHHFPNELGSGDTGYLVRSTCFEYKESQVASLLTKVTTFGHGKTNGTYSSLPMPALSLWYTEPPKLEDLTVQDSEAPFDLAGDQYQWIDIDSEGLPGVLSEQAGGWFYRRNLSANNLVNSVAAPRFGPIELMKSRPAPSLHSAGTKLTDLDGTGNVDLVVINEAEGVRGFYERTTADGWTNFLPFSSWPNIDLSQPNVQFVDLTGNGRADILVTEHEAFSWFPSLGKAGYAEARRAFHSNDEEKGPKLVFADGTQNIYLADFSGDGLHDLVRIRNGDICYWPSLGYGQFGEKVTMDNSPWFDHVDQFTHVRLRLSDIDGSGTTDLIYLPAEGGADIYLNFAGNGWSTNRRLRSFPKLDNISVVSTVDLLGNGCSCLVWTSPLSARNHSLHYIDLTQSKKPFLLETYTNDVGLETRVSYAPSTRFYLDAQNDKPWSTRLPFPVHCVEVMEKFDHVSKSYSSTRYGYHDGFYDRVEREFRGFGVVQQWENEGGRNSKSFPSATNMKDEYLVAPTWQKTWFHTGANIMTSAVPNHPSIADYFGPALLLDGTLVPGDISGCGYGEASRSLKGRILREEFYAIDPGEGAKCNDQLPSVPFHVRENNYTITVIQPESANRHAVLHVSERESMTVNREQDPEDSRVIHTLALEHDKYGNKLRSISVAYGRTAREHSDIWTASAQGQTHVVYSESGYTNDINLDDVHVIPQLWKTREYHLTGVHPVGKSATFTFNQFQDDGFRVLDVDAHDIPFETTPTPALGIQKRLIAGSNALYLKNDLIAILDNGVIESLMLPGISYKLALTPGLVAAVYQEHSGDISRILSEEGGYVDIDDSWWISSGRAGFGPLPSSAPDLAVVRENFFTYKTFTDPFHQTTVIEYDEYNLLPLMVTDPLDNIVSTVNNYVHMQPQSIVDINGNRKEVVQNPLGEVVGTAIRGRVGERVGDSLEGFDWDVTDEQLFSFLGNPGGGTAAALLGTASTRTITVHNFSPRTTAPSFRAAIARETHASDSTSCDRPPKLLISFTYYDGLGREIQVKTQTDQGTTEDRVQADRWHGSGWTVWNNRGLAVRQYEPFFDWTHEFVNENKHGDSSDTSFYDHLERPVCTFSPDGTWTKVIYDSWQKTTYDASDLLKFDPTADPDVARFYEGWKLEYPDCDTWYSARTKDGTSATSLEKAAAVRSEPHHNTPTVMYLDSLGREISKVQSNGDGLFFNTRKDFDILANVRSVIDAQDREIVRAVFDLSGQVLHHSTMDFGQERVVYDVAGQIILRFQDQDIRIRTEYDALRRATGHYNVSASGQEIQFEKFVYGDERGLGVPADHNARGRIYNLYDQSGVVTTQYDFKGNIVATERQLAREYNVDIDWSSTITPTLESEKFINTTSFDAMNRPTELSVDGLRTRNCYNRMSLISSVETLALSPPPTNGVRTAPPSWVSVITSTEYNSMGHKILILYGNDTRKEFIYDKHTLRLMRARTRTLDRNTTRQDLQYTYDPRGNITHIDDKAQLDIDGVSASKDYTYDPINRLIESSGRKDMAAEGAGRSLLVGYTEKYTYDSTGNMLSVQYCHADSQYPGRTKQYRYNDPMSLWKGKFTNRLSEIKVGGKTECFVYDVHGNIISMAGFSVMEWDFQNQLRKTSRQVTGGNKLPETTYYVYGSNGNRVRKVTERQAAPDVVPTRLYDTIYLGGGLEIFRKYLGNGSTLSLERKTASIGSETIIRRVMTQRWETSGVVSDPPLFRYQLPDHLGSVALELDNVGDILSYEEYSAYGETTYQAPLNIPKAYRFSGKEQDTETGLYYFGARYYAAAVGRWISPDPIGIGDGPNVYCYVSCNPISFVDLDGKVRSGGPSSDDHSDWLNQFRPRSPQVGINVTGSEAIRSREITAANLWYHFHWNELAGTNHPNAARRPAHVTWDVLNRRQYPYVTNSCNGYTWNPIIHQYERYQMRRLHDLTLDQLIKPLRHAYELVAWRSYNDLHSMDSTTANHETPRNLAFDLFAEMVSHFHDIRLAGAGTDPQSLEQAMSDNAHWALALHHLGADFHRLENLPRVAIRGPRPCRVSFPQIAASRLPGTTSRRVAEHRAWRSRNCKLFLPIPGFSV